MKLSGVWKWAAVAVLIAIGEPGILERVGLDAMVSGERGAPSRPSAPQSTPPSKSTPRDGASRMSMPLCTNGRKAPAGGSCVIDGDSGWLEGRQWRVEGVDAPEIGKPECPAERETGEKANRRLAALLSGGFNEDRGRDDRYGRQLITFRLRDGRDAGVVLISERVAQEWPNRGNVWCSRSRTRYRRLEQIH